MDEILIKILTGWTYQGKGHHFNLKRVSLEKQNRLAMGK